MKVLLVSATQAEVAPLLKSHQNAPNFKINDLEVTILVTGVGMVATAYSMGLHLYGNAYDLAINAGIAGAFDRTLLVGDIVEVVEDCFAELGAEDGEEFLPIDKLGFGESHLVPLGPKVSLQPLKQVKAITVSRVHGNETTIYNTMRRLHPQVESMEGAAFFYACNQQKLASTQIRAVSNYVERRNLSQWDIPLAIGNLNRTIIQLLESL